jgi:guanylate kinase
VSHTTRGRREGEEDGLDYIFVDTQHFEDLKSQNELLEYTLYNGNLYGTSFAEIQKILEKGKYPIMDLDLNGVLSSFKALGKENYFGVWIDAPEQKILLERLLHR